jgi:hypothetical protein
VTQAGKHPSLMLCPKCIREWQGCRSEHWDLHGGRGRKLSELRTLPARLNFQNQPRSKPQCRSEEAWENWTLVWSTQSCPASSHMQ